MAKGYKKKEFVSEEDCASLISGLAELLGGEISTALTSDGLEKLTLSIKKIHGGAELRVKLKPESIPLTVEQLSGAKMPKYSHLKKEMKKSFAALKKNLEASEVPDPDLVSTFLSQSALMVRYPGKGDEYYDQYTGLCGDFAEAAENKDVNGMNQAWKQLMLSMKACHKIYK